jgi:hypothetical protein
LLVPGAYPTPTALAFTGITPQEFTFILWFCIAVCPYVCQDSLIGKERMSRLVGGNKMSVLNLEDVIVEAAVELATSGECDLPIDNKFGGVDLVAPGYYDSVPYARGLIFTNGVRFAIEDNVIHIYKFENYGIVAHATFVASLASLSSVLVAVAKEWI